VALGEGGGRLSDDLGMTGVIWEDVTEGEVSTEGCGDVT